MKIIAYIIAATISFSAYGQTNLNKLESPNQNNQNKQKVAFKNPNSSLDSIEKANRQNIINSGTNINKALICGNSIHLTATMRADHRFFGYSRPDTNSTRLLLLSIYTSDVENNPFQCRLGAYYETGGTENLLLKYQSTTGDFIRALATTKTNKATVVYFQKQWMKIEAGN